MARAKSAAYFTAISRNGKAATPILDNKSGEEGARGLKSRYGSVTLDFSLPGSFPAKSPQRGGWKIIGGTRILVVEDDLAINKVVASYLGKFGAHCTAAFSGSEGLLRLAAEPFDLVVTDLMLPGADGEEVVACCAARNLPVIVLSARATVADRVDLLRTGADDYLVKPFDLDELLARCEAVLRRRGNHAGLEGNRKDVDPQPSAASPAEGVPPAQPGVASGGNSGDEDLLRFGLWQLDPAARSFSAAGAPVYLTRTEYEIVSAFMAHPRQVHTKRSLSQAAAGSAEALEDKTVATHIGNIRAKLRGTGTENYIETVWGVGFKLCDLG